MTDSRRDLTLDAALGLSETNEQELLAEILRRGPLLPDDILFLSGSLIETLGNRLSDIDVYVISERDLAGCFGRRPDAFEFKGLMIDLQMVARREVDELLGRLESLPSAARYVSRRFSFADWQFLHRLMAGRAPIGEVAFAAIQGRVTLQTLARFKLEWATEWITRLQVDLAGLHAGGDWQSMLFVAQQLLGYSVDCLLAAYGLTNPSPKWRIRLLNRLPARWESCLPGRHTGLSATDRYLTLSQTPARLDASSVYAYALRAVGFARIVVPWAEWGLRHGASVDMPGLRVDARRDDTSRGSPLPFLALDVQTRYDGCRFLLRKVDTPRHLLPISTTVLSILSLYDGETSSQAVSEVIVPSAEAPISAADVDSLVRHFQLAAPSFAADRVLRPALDL